MSPGQPRASRDYSEEDALALTSCAQTALSIRTIPYPIIKFDELRAVAAAPVAALGGLELLATELQQMILGYLNITSLSAFARVNRAARRLILDLPDLRFVLNNAPGCLSVLIRTNAAQWLSPADVRSVMRESRCHGCSAFTTLVDLLHCRRSCLMCIMLKKSFSRAALAWGRLSTARGSPLESSGMRVLKGITIIEDLATAQYIFHAYQPELCSLTDPQLVERDDYEEIWALAQTYSWEWSWSFKTHLMIPIWIPAAGITDGGRFCRGCQAAPSYRTRLERPALGWENISALKQYSTTEFKDHAKTCSHAKEVLNVRRSRRNLAQIAE